MTLQRKPEWSFQKWAFGFLQAVVLEPREIRSIDKAGSVRSVQSWAAAKARGVKDGTGDVLAVQGEPLCVAWVECKRPDGGGVISPTQTATADAYKTCGVPTTFASTIQEVLDGLRAAGIRVSANADTVAAVYQAHVDASERTRAAAAPVKRAAGKPRVRVGASKIRKAHRVGLWR